MSQISTGQVPPNGWRFQVGDNWIRGETFAELVQNLDAHKQSNGLPEGDSRQEIMDQICALNPSTCLNNQPPPGGYKVSTALERFRTFATTLLAHVKAGGSLVDQSKANVRSEICSKCHNNVSSKEAKGSGCLTCGMEEAGISILRKQILGDRTTPLDSKIKTCALCGCDLKLKIWFRREVLGVNENNQNAYPDFCWLKQSS